MPTEIEIKSAEQAERVLKGLKDGTVEIRDFAKLKPGLKLDYNRVLQECVMLYQGAKLANPKIVLPVNEYQNTKKNKTRLDETDKTCPMGLVIKGDVYANATFHPYASARFDLRDMIQWLFQKVQPTKVETPEVDKITEISHTDEPNQEVKSDQAE